MDRAYLPYLLTDGDFYDVPWAEDRTLGPELLDGLALPRGWRARTRGPWALVSGSAPMPASGWKVHVTTTPQRCGSVVPRVVAVSAHEGVPCKALRTRRLVHHSQGKYADPTACGKVVTAYPSDDEALGRLVRALLEALAGERGPRVVGDVTLVGGVVSVRHGAFVGEADDTADGGLLPVVVAGGRRMPDRRGAGADAPPLPGCLAGLVDPPARDVLPLRAARLLHRTCAGGVYAAEWVDGRGVVVKEGRRLAALDGDEVDAATRLDHEWSALQRLAGSGVAPEPVERLVAGDSELVVMTHVDGEPLTRRPARGHPVARAGTTTPGAGAAARDYVRWVDDVHRLASESLRVAHDHGVVHGDVHPDNLLDTGARVVLVDFESCLIDGRGVGSGVRAPGYGGPGRTAETDLAALDDVRWTLLAPESTVAHRSPGLRDAARAEGLRRLRSVEGVGVSARPGPLAVPPADETDETDEIDEADGTGWTTRPDVAEIARAVVASATPTRTDRLFPGDIRTFAKPDGGLGLLHGAAGVITVLAGLGHEPALWLDWLTERSLAALRPSRGLGTGLDGVAVALALAGRRDEAVAVAHRGLGNPGAPVPWWSAGSAGRAVAAAEVAALTGDDRLAGVAAAECQTALACLDADEGLLPLRPGLVEGWSGVALALLRLTEIPCPTAPYDHLVHAAGKAVGRDLAGTELVDDARLVVHEGKRLPYLGLGSAGIGLALVALRERTGDASLSAPVDAVSRCLAVPQMLTGGLLSGRAGLLASLRRMGSTTGVAGHESALAWHTVPGETGTHCLGDQNLRCSADVATGAAGYLMSLRAQGNPLHDVLRLPSGARTPGAVTPMTA